MPAADVDNKNRDETCPYKSLFPLARVLRRALIVPMVLAVFSIALTVIAGGEAISIFSASSDSKVPTLAYAWSYAMLLTRLSQWVVFVIFMVWLRRAVLNLYSFGEPGTAKKAWQCTLGFFLLPFCFYAPATLAAQTWRLSSPGVSHTSLMSKEPAPGCIWQWWASYLLLFITSEVADWLAASVAIPYFAIVAGYSAHYFVQIALNFFVLQTVNLITLRQLSKRANIEAQNLEQFYVSSTGHRL